MKWNTDTIILLKQQHFPNTSHWYNKTSQSSKDKGIFNIWSISENTDFDSKQRALSHVRYVEQLPPILLLFVYYWCWYLLTSTQVKKYKLKGKTAQNKNSWFGEPLHENTGVSFTYYVYWDRGGIFELST